MQVGLVSLEGVELSHSARQVAVRVGRLHLRVRDGLGLRRHGLSQLGGHGVGVFDEALVVRLSLGLRSRSILLKLIGVFKNLLEQTHDGGGTSIGLVLVELFRRRLNALLEVDHLLADALAVEVLKACEGLLEHGLRGTLVCHHLLELGVLCLTVLACLLDLGLGGSDLCLRRCHLLSDPLDLGGQRVKLGLEVALVLCLGIGELLVLVQLLDAIRLELDLLLLLVLQLCEHLVHHLLHLREGVQLRGECQRGELRARALRDGAATAVPSSQEVLRIDAGQHGGTPQGLDCPGAPGSHGRGALVVGDLLQEAHSLCQQLAVVVLGQDGDGLADGLELLGTRLTPALPFLVLVVASELQVPEELHVGGALLARELEVLLRVGQCLLVRGVLRLVCIELFLSQGNLLLLRCRKLLVGLDGLHLRLLHGAELG
mmetsp:Transcript_1475/g.5008  ORF Transcript_1475/g.5008 Transcript_1475/m.5008 type:complete len:430 (-) Transcript_1475:308-1597(-)